MIQWQKFRERKREEHKEISLKRGILKKGIALLTIAALAFASAGCGGEGGNETVGGGNNSTNGTDNGGSGSTGDNSDADNTAKGRYMETQLTTPEYFQGNGKLTQLSDGSLVIVDFDNGIKNISSDQGRTWSSEKVAKLQSLINYGETVRGAVAPDGGIFLYYVTWEDSTEEKLYPEKYIYLTPDGEATEFELGLEEYHTCTEDAAFTPDGRLFVVTNSDRVYEIDPENHTAKSLFQLESVWDLDMCANDTQLVIQDGTEAYFYHLDSGEVTAEDGTLNSFLQEQTDQKAGIVMCMGGDGVDASLYLASMGGIYHHVIDGSVMEQLADGTLNNLGDPTRTPVSMLQLQEETFLILYGDGELYSYVYDPEASAVPEEQITIYSLYDNETVRRAISVFRKANPDVFVRLEVGLSGEDGMTESDAIHNLNTRLLAGEGPDLLLLNGMPMDSYVEKGILVDLSGEVADLKAENAFFEGILEGYEQDNKIFALPFRYEIPVLSGESAKIASVTDLNTLADAAESIAGSGQVEKTVLGNYTEEELLEQLYLLCANAWITEDDQVDEEALREFLTAAKRIYMAEQANLSAEERMQHEESVIRMWNYYSSEQEARRALYGVENQAIGCLFKEQVLIAGYMCSMDEYATVLSVNKEYDASSNSYRFQVWNGQNANIFCPTGIVGLCTNAKNPECAKRFLKTLLQPEVQKADLGDGFPVNQDAYEEFVFDQEPETNLSYAICNEDGTYVGWEMIWPNTDEKEELKELIHTLKTPASTDNVLKSDIISMGARVLTGEWEIDKCVEEIKQKISLHLQE